MKHLFAVGLIVCLSSVASAQSEDTIANCRVLSEGARKVMEHRQAGSKLADLMEWAHNNTGYEELSKYMVITAYKQPAYLTQRHQERAITKFENAMYLECITAAEER